MLKKLKKLIGKYEYKDEVLVCDLCWTAVKKCDGCGEAFKEGQNIFCERTDGRTIHFCKKCNEDSKIELEKEENKDKEADKKVVVVCTKTPCMFNKNGKCIKTVPIEVDGCTDYIGAIFFKKRGYGK